jgi:hypothetical protein
MTLQHALSAYVPNSLCAPLVFKHWPPHFLKALATHSFKSIGHPHIIQATCFRNCPVVIFWNCAHCQNESGNTCRGINSLHT